MDNVENTSFDTQRIRSNSVIDSNCLRKHSAVLEVTEFRSRSKSLSTTDYYVCKLNLILQIFLTKLELIFLEERLLEFISSILLAINMVKL